MSLLSVVHTRAVPPANLQSINTWSNVWNFWSTWSRFIQEPFTGAWQRNLSTSQQSNNPLVFSAVYACVTGIASDIAKNRIKLTENENGIWEEITEEDTHGNAQAAPWLRLLEKPNHYQTRLKFIEQWMLSKLIHGNTYILKRRRAGEVIALYVLDPRCVTVLVAEDGGIFYQIKRDYLSEQPEESPIFPASEIIHDMMPGLYHPLFGISPLSACNVSAAMGSKIQSSSQKFFDNAARPGGILSPTTGEISREKAQLLKEAFESDFGGDNIGRLAIMTNAMKYEPFEFFKADVQQLVEQLAFTVEDVARAFHYPLWKLTKVGAETFTNVQARNVVYYSDCLQVHFEAIEDLLKVGLDMPVNISPEFDTDNLLRMDTVAQFEALTKAEGILETNEQRFKAGYGPTEGGDAVYKQEQNYSLAALAKRDSMENPFQAKNQTQQTQAAPPTPQPQRGLSSSEIENAFWQILGDSGLI